MGRGPTRWPPSPPLFAHPVQSAESDERWTPPQVFDALGITFDLDVAAPPGGVPWIPAARSFDASMDGLAQIWTGRVWCNPPFSNTGPWARRFAEHGDGVILFPFSGNASWMYTLIRRLSAVLILEHIAFVHPTHTGRHVPVGVGLAGLGDVCEAAVIDATAILPGVLLRPVAA